jgi:hypothetical protein
MFVDGLKQNSLVKIDVWSYLNSKITEITNAYFLSYGTGANKVEVQSSNNIKDLQSDVEKLYYSNMWFSPFKMSKRAYALIRQLIGEENLDKDTKNPLHALLTSFSVVNYSSVALICQIEH